MSALDATVRLEHGLIAVEQEHRVDALLEIRAPDAPAAVTHPPATVVLVVDTSGSMAGDRLLTARDCVTWLASRLGPDDRVALVGFDDAARLLSPPVPPRDTRFAFGVAQLLPGGCTNLSAGLLLGLEQARQVPRGPGPRSVILLTDGWANQGETRPGVLASVCAAAAREGIRVSTVGVGDAFSEDLLTTLGDAGGGRAHHAPTVDAAPAIFAEELDGLTRLAVQTVSVEARPRPPVARLDLLNDLPSVGVPGGVRVDLGDVHAGAVRRLVMRFAVPHVAGLGPCAVADLVVRWVDVADMTHHTRTVPVIVNVVDATEAAAHAGDPEVTHRVVSLLAQRARAEAIRSADAGRHADAAFAMRTARDALAAFAPRSPHPAETAATMAAMDEDIAGMAPGAWSAHERKRAHYRVHRARRDRDAEDHAG